MRALPMCLVVCAVSSLTPPGPAMALPLNVRARTAVTMELQRTRAGVVLQGRLLDDQGLPVAGEHVRLDIGGLGELARTTDGSGGFEIVINPRELRRLEQYHGQRLPWRVRFEGKRLYGQTQAKGVLDLNKQSTNLSIRLEPELVGLDATRVRVHVDLATRQDAIAEADVRVQVGDGTELIGTTGEAGRATFLIRAGLLGAAGAYDVRARFLGDHRYAGSTAHATLRVLLPTRVTLRVGREGGVRMGRYRFSGRLADADGPVADATIAIVARRVNGDGGSEAAEPELQTLALTDATGVYLTAVQAREFLANLEGELDLRAVYRPNDERHQSAISRPVRLTIPPPPGVPAHWYLSGILLTVGLLALALLLRHRVPQQLWRRLRAWRAPPTDLPAPANTEEQPAFVVASAPAPGRPAPLLNRVAGVTVDGHSRAPLAGARILIRCLSGERPSIETFSCAAGRFAVDELPPGRYRLEISAPEYLPRDLDFRVPHTGDLDGATFSLIAIRRRIRDAYARAIVGLEGRFAWGVDTPLEALDALRRTSQPEARGLVELRSMVELAWFSHAPLTSEDAIRAHQILDHLEARRG